MVEKTSRSLPEERRFTRRDFLRSGAALMGLVPFSINAIWDLLPVNENGDELNKLRTYLETSAASLNKLHPETIGEIKIDPKKTKDLVITMPLTTSMDADALAEAALPIIDLPFTTYPSRRFLDGQVKQLGSFPSYTRTPESPYQVAVKIKDESYYFLAFRSKNLKPYLSEGDTGEWVFMPDRLMGIEKLNPNDLPRIRKSSLDNDKNNDEYPLLDYYHGRGLKATIERSLRAQGVDEKVAVYIRNENNYYTLAEGTDEALFRTLPSFTETAATSLSYGKGSILFSAAAVYTYGEEEGQKIEYKWLMMPGFVSPNQYAYDGFDYLFTLVHKAPVNDNPEVGYERVGPKTKINYLVPFSAE